MSLHWRGKLSVRRSNIRQSPAVRGEFNCSCNVLWSKRRVYKAQQKPKVDWLNWQWQVCSQLHWEERMVKPNLTVSSPSGTVRKTPWAKPSPAALQPALTMLYPLLQSSLVLTSPLLESLDSPKTSRNFCRLLPITEETCSAASNPGPSPAALDWAPEILRREAVTLIRLALLPVPELLLPPGRAGNRHRQLCAILHSLPVSVCPALTDTSVGGTLTQHST